MLSDEVRLAVFLQALSQHFNSRVCNEQCMLELSGQLAVLRDRCPVVRPLLVFPDTFNITDNK